MTLGEMVDLGLSPSKTQVWFLENQESRKCTEFGNDSHEFHCYSLSNGKVRRETCYKVRQLRVSLKQLFPLLKIKES